MSRSPFVPRRCHARRARGLLLADLILPADTGIVLLPFARLSTAYLGPARDNGEVLRATP